MQIAILAEKGDGIFDAVKMVPFFFIKGCWASVALQRQNDTTDRWPGLPSSRVGCRLRPLVFHQLENVPALFSVSLKMDDATQSVV